MSTAIDMHAYGLVQLYLKVQTQVIQRLDPQSAAGMLIIQLHTM